MEGCVFLSLITFPKPKTQEPKCEEWANLLKGYRLATLEKTLLTVWKLMGC